jgi:hypothetical protein
MKLSMLCATPHHTVAIKNTVIVKMYGGLLPIVSDRRPKRGWKLVEVKRNAVDSHDALFELWKYEVMIGWLDTIIVESKQATKYDVKMLPKISQNLATLTPARNGDFGSSSSSSSLIVCSLPTVLVKDFFREMLARLDLLDSFFMMLYFRGPRSIAVSCDAGSTPSPEVYDSDRERRLSNSLGSISLFSSSALDRDSEPSYLVPLSAERRVVLSSGK